MKVLSLGRKVLKERIEEAINTAYNEFNIRKGECVEVEVLYVEM